MLCREEMKQRQTEGLGGSFPPEHVGLLEEVMFEPRSGTGGR